LYCSALKKIIISALMLCVFSKIFYKFITIFSRLLRRIEMLCVWDGA